MLTTFFSDPGDVELIRAFVVGARLDDFAVHLGRQGYAHVTIQNYVRAAAHLGLWATRQGIPPAEIDHRTLELFGQHLQNCVCPEPRRLASRASGVARCSERFIQYLHDSGISKRIQAPPAAAPSTTPPLLVGFRSWMLLHRGVTETTIRIYERYLAQALDVLGEDPSSYDAAGLRAFVLSSSRIGGRSRTKLAITALRMFVRYLIATKQCAAALLNAILTIAGWRRAALPRYLPAADIDRMLATCDSSTPIGVRDRAVILLLCRLGLRAGDVVRLRCDDIDWSRGTIRLSGKSRRAARLPLVQEVGDAMIEYLNRGRAQADFEQFFLRATPPWAPLAGCGTVSRIVKKAIIGAGVNAPGFGTHMLRHSAAREMVRQGVSLTGIGIMLRHQSLETTVQYAKVDVMFLQQITQPWPEVFPC